MPDVTLSSDMDAFLVTANDAAARAELGLVAIAASGSASDLSAGTVPNARFPATLPAASGVNLTALNASNLASGTVADARLSVGAQAVVSGAVIGPASAVDGNVALYDGTTGKLVKDSGVTITGGGTESLDVVESGNVVVTDDTVAVNNTLLRQDGTSGVKVKKSIVTVADDGSLGMGPSNNVTSDGVNNASITFYTHASAPYGFFNFRDHLGTAVGQFIYAGEVGSDPGSLFLDYTSSFALRRALNGSNTLTMSGAGALRLHDYGAGTLTTDGSGNVTAVSDIRLKNVDGSFTQGLDAVLQLEPIVFHWNAQSGLNVYDVNVGFSAQSVQKVLPEAVGGTPNGFLTLLDRPILCALVNAVKELHAQIEELKRRCP